MEVDNTITYKFQSPKLFLFDSKQKKNSQSVIPNTTKHHLYIKKKFKHKITQSHYITKKQLNTKIHSRRRILAKDIGKKYCSLRFDRNNNNNNKKSRMERNL